MKVSVASGTGTLKRGKMCLYMGYTEGDSMSEMKDNNESVAAVQLQFR